MVFLGLELFSQEKESAKLFNEKYLKPLAIEAVKYFGSEISSNINDHIKSRHYCPTIAGQDVSKMNPQDQMKIIGLIYKKIFWILKGYSEDAMFFVLVFTRRL